MLCVKWWFIKNIQLRKHFKVAKIDNHQIIFHFEVKYYIQEFRLKRILFCYNSGFTSARILGGQNGNGRWSHSTWHPTGTISIPSEVEKNPRGRHFANPRFVIATYPELR